MAYKGQPFESTVYHAARAKISDGKSVRVKSGSVAVDAGKFYLLEGFLGAAMTSATAAETDKEVILNIEPAEYETDQIKADDKNSMTIGENIYWDDSEKEFTVTAKAVYAGKITAAADENDVIWFKLAERPFAVDDVTILSTQVGDIGSLTTTAKNAVVAAVNEVNGKAGDLTSLTTTADASLVAAVNELDGNIGDLGSLDTTVDASLVAAVNELNGNIGDLTKLETTADASLVAAVNEVVEDIIGDLTDLDPAPDAATTVVGVFNEKVAENVAEIADAGSLTADDTAVRAIAGKVNTIIEKLIAAKLMAAD